MLIDQNGVALFFTRPLRASIFAHAKNSQPCNRCSSPSANSSFDFSSVNPRFPRLPLRSVMVKKPVPDWLNSSIWSSPPDLSAGDRPRRCDFSSYVVDESPPPPVPPPAPAESLNSKSQPQSLKSDDDGDANGASTSSALSADDISRQAQLLVELSKKMIDMREVRRLASMGIADGAGIRAPVWKLLLGYLPSDRSSWSSELSRKRHQYKRFKEELLMSPSEVLRTMEKLGSLDYDHFNCEGRGLLPRSDVTDDDHPLSLCQSSLWNQYFQDTDILEQIDRDVKRTHPDIHFFCGDSSFAKSNQDSLRNILIVFAKLNPGIRYVQGMNEILAPLFYVFRSDPDEENAAYAEPDAFFCFVELLSGFRDYFCQQLDNSIVGIRSTITRLSELLKEHDEELWRHLEVTCKINPQFYSFRWITLLLTQEFNFSESLLIWDALLSDPEGPPETLLRICCAMLIIIRRRLLAGDFTSNLKLLQHYPSTTNISHLLYVANKLRALPSN